MSYTITLTTEQQAGFDFQSALTGEAVADMIQRLIGEKGMSYFADKKRHDVEEMMRKIQLQPDAFKVAVDTIAEPIIAQIEAEKQAELEAEEKELIKG